MRLYQLFEAPLADFDAVGDLDREGSIRPEDLRAIRNPKWREKVFRAFQNTAFNFNIYVFNAPEGIAPVGRGYGFDSDPIKVNDLANLNKYAGVQRLGVIANIIGKTPPDANTSITVLLVENEGAQRLPLTPWILAHRVGHAVIESVNSGRQIDMASDLVAPIRSTFEVFNTFFNTVERRLFQSPRYKDAIALTDDRMNAFAKIIGTFRSARMGKLSNSGEFLVESFAQYLIQGSVKFQRPELDDNGRTPPLDPSIDPELLAIARQSRHKENFIEAVLKPKFFRKRYKSFPVKPEAFYQGLDANGKPVATSSTNREEVWKQRGLTTRYVEPSKRELATWNDYQQQWQALSDMYDKFAKTNLLWSGDTNTDLLDNLLSQAEKDLNERFEVILNACVGKAIVL